jgi:tRNA nucleotidyltransferase/poly(A) polymerase
VGLEIHIYDFDGTLFHSPEMPEGWDSRWWISSESLNPPCVPIEPSGEWWIPSTVSAAKASISNPEVFAVMMTGRPVASSFRYRVPELLKSAGLRFDEVYLSDTNNTPAFKIKVIKKLLARFPNIEKVVFWDDNGPYMKSYVDLVEGFGYEVETNLVTVPAMECGEIPPMPSLKKKASEQVEVMKFLSAVARSAGVAEHVYVVGGAVRNFIIGQPIKDVDVVIDSVALRGRDSAWFARKIADSLPCDSSLVTNNYGVAILTIKGPWVLNGYDLSGEVIEIANARKESYGGDTGKGYKPSTVEPATIQEDVVRREFTFNTLLWRLHDLADGPDKAEIIDLSGCGLKDLQTGTMRCPNDPDIIFSDDPSRMVRAIKFLIKYGFKIDPEVAASIRRNAHKLKKMPAAHLSTMLVDTFFEPGVGKKALLEMGKLGLLDVIREIAQENKPFKAALDNWANKRSGLEFLFDLLDLQMPMGKRLSVVPLDLLPHFRAYSEAEPEKALALLDVLDQPGRKFDMPGLIRALGISGAEIKSVTNTIRRLLVLNPDINESDLYRKLSQGKTATDFGARSPLMDAANKKVTYRIKADTSGILVALYAGSRRVGAMDAYPFSNVYNAKCAKDIWRLLEQYPILENTTSPRWVDREGRSHPRIEMLSVNRSDVAEDFRGLGVGKAMYLAIAAEWFDRNGPFLFMADECSSVGSTSAPARAVWDSLAKVYPSSGRVLAILKKPSLPSQVKMAAVPDKYSHIDFKPPKSVAEAAKKGLEYREKASPSNKGGLTPAEASKQGIGSGVQRAVNLKNRDNISPDVVRQMVAFFSRHEKNRGVSPENKGTPWNDKGNVSWLIWGGDPGRSWAEKIRDQMDAADEEADKKKAVKKAARAFFMRGEM